MPVSGALISAPVTDCLAALVEVMAYLNPIKLSFPLCNLSVFSKSQMSGPLSAFHDVPMIPVVGGSSSLFNVHLASG